jgi:4'-phosphopantetheinyl transferase
MFLKKGEIHIWKYRYDEQDHILEKTFPTLSEEEQDRFQQYFFQDDAIRFICIHRFVRQVLAMYLNMAASAIVFSYTEKGKPYLDKQELFFNYSYRKDVGLLAVSGHQEIGADVEKKREIRDVDVFADFCFSENEKRIISDAGDDNHHSLFALWTMKEALIKALGKGLSTELPKIDLSKFYQSEFNELLIDNNEYYTIKNVDCGEDYMGAFATKGKVETYMEFTFGEKAN